MTAYYAAQVALGVVAAAIVAERIRALMYRASLPLRPFRRVLLALVRTGQAERARRLGEAARPAWVGEVASCMLSAHADGLDAERLVEPVLLEMRYEAGRGLWALRVMASVASASGVLGALWQLLRVLEGRVGLEGLEAGLAERMAFQRALLSLLIGAMVATVALYARSVLARQARRLLGDVGRLSEELAGALQRPAGEEDEAGARGVHDPTDAP